MQALTFLTPAQRELLAAALVHGAAELADSKKPRHNVHHAVRCERIHARLQDDLDLDVRTLTSAEFEAVGIAILRTYNDNCHDFPRSSALATLYLTLHHTWQEHYLAGRDEDLQQRA